jgi:hypothetical protein
VLKLAQECCITGICDVTIDNLVDHLSKVSVRSRKVRRI